MQSNVEYLHLQESATASTSVHLLPCTIEYTGPAKVAKYFSPTGELGAARSRQLDHEPHLNTRNNNSVLYPDLQRLCR
jgi:hypothetical protein